MRAGSSGTVGSRSTFRALAAWATLACLSCGPSDTAVVSGATDDTAAVMDAAIDDAAPVDAALVDADAQEVADALSLDADAVAPADAPTGCVPSYLSGDATSSCATFVQKWLCPASAKFTALAAASDGGFLLVGSIGDAAWIVRITAKGSVVWQKVFPELTVADDVAASSDGGWGIACVKNKMQALLKLDAQGATVWLQTWPQAWSVQSAPSKVTALPDGGFALACQFSAGTKTVPGILRLDASGATVWQAQVNVKNWPHYGAIRSFVRLPDGDFAMSTYGTYPPGYYHEGFESFSADGLPLQDTSTDTDEVLAVSASGALLAGCNVNGGKAGWFTAYVRGLSATGGIDWETWLTPIPSDKHTMVWWNTSAFAAFSNGDSVIASFEYAQNPYTRIFRWSRVAANGQFAWQRSAAAGDAMLGLGDGGIASVGWEGEAPDTTPLFVRADRWGNTSCPDTMACQKMAASTCDDGNGCTSDYCVAPGDCTHTALDDSTPCATLPDMLGGGKGASSFPKSCLAGVCVAK